MSLLGAKVVCDICKKFQKLPTVSRLLPTSVTAFNCVPSRNATNKHWDPKWKKLRAKKVFKMDLPDYVKLQRESTMEPPDMRAKMKKDGQAPPRIIQERNIIISSTSAVFEEYVPPEGDGVASPVSTEGAKQRLTELEKKGKSRLQLRKIRQYEDDFSTAEFAETAQEIYIKAHNMLTDIETNDLDLHDLVTEKAFPEMVWNLKHKTFRWKFIQSLEPPKVVHLRTTHLINKDNLYAQATVRFHTQQTLAIYDRFGRLMFGSEKSVKDSLEYVVFEKHLSDEYGVWRIHAKLIPDWMPPRQSLLRTMRQPKFDPIEDEEEASSAVQEAQPEGAQLATA